MNIGSLWRSTTEEIGDRHMARWLCEVATSLDGAEFVEAIDEPVTQAMVAHLDAMLARYRSGEPLQYVLGRWSFRHLDLAVDPRVLIPRPETELVAGLAIELARQIWEIRRSVEVIDLGTGSGAIGLSLATELPVVGTRVWMTDVDPDAADVARANLAGIGRGAANVRIAVGSWFDAVDRDARFDVVVSNPPYVADESPDLEDSVAAWEPHHALFAGAEGLDAYRIISAETPARLRPGGWLVLEIGADQGAAVARLLAEAGFCEIQIRPDLAGRDRIAVGRQPSTER